MPLEIHSSLMEVSGKDLRVQGLSFSEQIHTNSILNIIRVLQKVTENGIAVSVHFGVKNRHPHIYIVI